MDHTPRPPGSSSYQCLFLRAFLIALCPIARRGPPSHPWITTHMMLCLTISSDKYVNDKSSSFTRVSAFVSKQVDTRVPLREPLLGTVRGGSSCPELRCRCQGTQRGCPRGVEHCVSREFRLLFMSMMTRIQILDSMPDLPRADKEQYGTFVVSLHSTIIGLATAYNILP